MNVAEQRVEEEEEREGDVSDDERDGQDGMRSGFTSPQGQRGAGGDKTRQSAASRGTAPPRASRQIGGIDPQRWGRGSREENGAPKRRRKEQRERARHELTSRLAASLSATSRSERQPDVAQAAESVDLDDREWDSAGGSVSGGDSGDDSQGVKAKMGSRGKRRRVVQLDPPQTKDDPLRAVEAGRFCKPHAGNHAGHECLRRTHGG